MGHYDFQSHHSFKHADTFTILKNYAKIIIINRFVFVSTHGNTLLHNNGLEIIYIIKLIQKNNKYNIHQYFTLKKKEQYASIVRYILCF